MTDFSRTIDVLIVEDNEADADLIEELLIQAARERYAFTTRSTLADAITALDQVKPDVVLLDLGLPDGTGPTNVTSVREANSNVPIIVFTGIDDEELALTCIDNGAEDFLWKSEVRANSLRRAIRYAITRYGDKRERARLENRLRAALTNVLSEYVPVCAHCQNVRSGDDSWTPLENYLAAYFSAMPSDTLCPRCEKGLDPELNGK